MVRLPEKPLDKDNDEWDRRNPLSGLADVGVSPLVESTACDPGARRPDVAGEESCGKPPTVSRARSPPPSSSCAPDRRSRDRLRTHRERSFCGPRGCSMRRANGCAAMRSEEHTSELQALMRSSYDVFCLQKKNTLRHTT